MSWMFTRTPELVAEEDALKGGRAPVLPNPAPHEVLGTPITGPWKDHQRSVLIGIGCFWGVEQMYWKMDGVESTSVGYAGGVTKNPTYREVCSERTNHAEIAEVVYDPEIISLDTIVAKALESHDPTQLNRQGNDVGTQYRSAFYTVGENAEADKQRIQELVDHYATQLAGNGFGEPTTEVKRVDETPAGEYYRAESEHQQYLEKVPNGYCPIHSTGVACNVPA